MQWVFNPFTGTLDQVAAGSGAGGLPVVQAVTGNGALSINFSNGRSVSLQLTGNVTSFAVTNWPANIYEGSLILNITNTGAFDILAWPAGAVSGNGIGPTIAQGAGKKTTVVLRTNDNGATVFVDQIAYDYLAI